METDQISLKRLYYKQRPLEKHILLASLTSVE